MPNWIEQQLHVVGRSAEITRFIRTGLVRRNPAQFDDLLHFRRLCPLKRGEATDTYTPDTGVVLSRFRTRTQAMFLFTTAWECPAAFYARLACHWPSLAFACSVNAEMGDGGGVILVRDGRVENLVRGYDAAYSRRRHMRDIARALRGWYAFLTKDRDFRLVPDAAWDHPSMPFDAHFDGDFWFYFRTREEVAAFGRRYASTRAMRRVGNEWKRMRL
jgi:hypothetical protein